jgi:hypothetical protein
VLDVLAVTVIVLVTAALAVTAGLLARRLARDSG